MSAPVFVLDRDRLVAGDTLVLDGAEGRHAATVARLGPGETVLVTDGAGLVATCRVTGAGRDRLELAVESRAETPPAQPRLVVVQALPKGDRGELAVAMMTEVGVDVVVPWAGSRCVTRWTGGRGEKALARWRSAAREAAKQSRRSWFPDVTTLATTAGVADLLRPAAAGIVLHEQARTPLATVQPPASGDVVLVVGPEGGVTPDELAAFESAGATAYGMGPTVLRTSTAGVTALAVLLARTARWGATGP